MIEWSRPQDQARILQAVESIRLTTPLAFFNWNETTFVEELKVSKTLVARGNDGPIHGFILFRENVDVLEVMVLGTPMEFQKKGVMSALIRFLQTYAAQQKKDIHLEVHARNEGAQRVYANNAFELNGKRKNYYRDGSEAWLYVWKNPVI